MISRRRLRSVLALLAAAQLSPWAAGADAMTSPSPTPPPSDPEALDTFKVNESHYQPAAADAPPILSFLSSGRPFRFNFSFGIPSVLSPLVVTASRTPQAPEYASATVKLLNAATLNQTPTVTLDGALRSIPGFTLFRRSDSLTANPTSQGVSLRGLGPSGASRSLVLLDGVPLNDPFGGWITWSKLPREGLARVELVPGGGATAWGNAALSGVVQFFSLPLTTELTLVDHPPAPITTVWRGSMHVALTAGDFGTRSAEVAVTAPAGSGIIQLLGREFSTDGFSLVAPERRGPIDVAAWSRHRWFTARWREPLGTSEKIEMTATVRGFEEFRGNGTPYQKNGSREKFAALNFAGQPSDNFTWTAVAYAQDQSFSSTFSSVNATRTAETPASNQFAVPAVSFGAAWTGLWQHAHDAHTSFGLDTRFVHGETREDFSYLAGNYTRLRVAGGSQDVTGVFVLHELPIVAGLRATFGARLDEWNESNGHRRESDLASGIASRDDHDRDLDGTAFSPSAGFVWIPAKGWTLRSNAQHAFRRPTLNELYRPFRQGSNLTEANPALRTESVTSAEVGIERSLYRAAPSASNVPPGKVSRPAPSLKLLTVGVTAFWNDLHDAVGNVTIARGPGTFPIVGTLAAGGIGRQRLNLDRTRTQGFELSATWNPFAELSFDASALFNDASVRSTLLAPALIGKRLAQVPRHSASFGATWQAPLGFKFTPRVRWIGRQFEDDENQLILGEVVVTDVGVSRGLGHGLELFISVENLSDARVETGRSADGVVNIGTPRLFLGGIRGVW